MSDKEDYFDWFEWAGVKIGAREELVEHAKNEEVPTFDDDSAEQIYNRILALKTLRNNQSTLLANKVLMGITLVSTIANLIITFLL